MRAPFDGVVTLRHTQRGAYLKLGAAVITLIDDHDMEIEADVPADRLDALNTGITVSFRLDNDSARHSARLRAVGVEENTRSRTRLLHFTPDFNGPTGKLENGQSVSLILPMERPRDILSIHKDAVTRGVNGTTVYVVADGIAERRLVRLGEAVGSRFELLEGLDPGDLVVVRGNERLRPGQAVRHESRNDDDNHNKPS